VYQERLNDLYETHQTAYSPTEGCIGKLIAVNREIQAKKISIATVLAKSIF
jgi:hypothetical protein